MFVAAKLKGFVRLGGTLGVVRRESALEAGGRQHLELCSSRGEAVLAICPER